MSRRFLPVVYNSFLLQVLVSSSIVTRKQDECVVETYSSKRISADGWQSWIQSRVWLLDNQILDNQYRQRSKNIPSFHLVLCNYLLRTIFGHYTLIIIKSDFFPGRYQISGTWQSMFYKIFDLSGTSGLCTFRLETHNIFLYLTLPYLPHVLSHDLEWGQPGIKALDTLPERNVIWASISWLHCWQIYVNDLASPLKTNYSFIILLLEKKELLTFAFPFLYFREWA